MTHYAQKAVCYLRHTRAVSALEYAILVGVIAVVMAAALVAFGGDITTALANIGGKVAGIVMPNLNVGGTN